MLDVSYQMAHKAIFHLELSSTSAPIKLMELLQGIIYDYVRHSFGCVPEWPRFCGHYQMETTDKRVTLQTAYLRDSKQGEKTLWAVRIQMRDYAVKRRTWLTHIGIRMHSHGQATVYFAQVYHDHLAGSLSVAKPVEYVAPRLYEKLLVCKRVMCKTGAFQVPMVAIPINSDLIEEFANLIRDPERHIPVLLISCPDLMDPELAAKKLVGNVVVCWIDDIKLMHSINQILAPELHIEWDSVQVILPLGDKPQVLYHPFFCAADMTRMGGMHVLNSLYRAYCTALRSDDRKAFVTVDGLYRIREQMSTATLQRTVKTLNAEKQELVDQCDRLTHAIKELQNPNNANGEGTLQQENKALEQLLNEQSDKREKLRNGIVSLTQRLYETMGKDFTPVTDGDPVLSELEHAVYVCFARLNGSK